MKPKLNVNLHLLVLALLVGFYSGVSGQCPEPSGQPYSKQPNPLGGVSLGVANKEKCSKALPAMTTAVKLVIGSTKDLSMHLFVNLMINESAENKKKFDDGLQLKDTLVWVKARASKADTAYLRKQAINDATQEVYGRIAGPLEVLFYDAGFKSQTVTFASIVLEERKKLNHNKTERRSTIDRAYMTVMGRNANADDASYWMPRSEIFTELVGAGRAYLYTVAGEKDLRATITRVFEEKKKTKPNTQEMEKAIEVFKAKRATYIEMLDENLDHLKYKGSIPKIF